MPLKTIPFDGSQYFDDKQSQAELVRDALGTADAKHMRLVIGVVARARGMTSIADEVGIARRALYDAVADDEEPDANVLLAVCKAMTNWLPPEEPEETSERDD